MEYNYLIVDASYFLRRNFMVVQHMVNFNYSALIDSFLNSIFKLRREHCPSGELILLFDKTPYICSERIKQYKKDREYITQTDVDKIKEELEKETDEVKKKELAEKVAQLEQRVKVEAVYMHAKSSLAKCLKGTLFNAIQVQGYEADNLAYLLSKMIPDGKRALLASVDSDWIYFVNNKVDYLRVRSKGRRDMYTTSKAFPELEESKQLGISLHNLGILKEIYYGGHNNVPGYCNLEGELLEFPDFAKLIYSQQNFSDSSTLTEYRNYYEALDIDTADNTEILKILEDTIKDDLKYDRDDKVKSYFEFLKLKPSHFDNYKTLRNRLTLDNIMEDFLI